MPIPKADREPGPDGAEELRRLQFGGRSSGSPEQGSGKEHDGERQEPCYRFTVRTDVADRFGLRAELGIEPLDERCDDPGS